MQKDDIRVIGIASLATALILIGALYNPVKRQINIWWPPTEFTTVVPIGDYSCGYRVASDGYFMRATPENPECVAKALESYKNKPCSKKK